MIRLDLISLFLDLNFLPGKHLWENRLVSDDLIYEAYMLHDSTDHVDWPGLVTNIERVMFSEKYSLSYPHRNNKST